ncbi:hypothetical protein SEA_KERBEROS_92 [Mycobacterium phage Kerberos]|nr:hypothetical protein M178_gp84 [Mycobacterium phage Chy5]AGK86119.1 hypothetical protein Chy5_0084 [Mycobacterium phage Chy5]AOQ27924.1 hypothetical protein SEA_POMAR16_92 [Mycobacterium phage Pomar16]APC43140.1 hypothetical protein SEA_KERBEROS_92 [Mycobacterium phage Kerberos]APC46208.1 hypothetical protein PBI_STARSTUFF_92 [Mycobacterium phage StarStuff]
MGGFGLMNVEIMVAMRRARRMGMNPWKTPPAKPKGSK